MSDNACDIATAFLAAKTWTPINSKLGYVLDQWFTSPGGPKREGELFIQINKWLIGNTEKSLPQWAGTAKTDDILDCLKALCYQG